MDLTRSIPQRYWRNLLILLLGLLVLASLSIVGLIVWELWSFQPLNGDQIANLPAWGKLLIPILQRDLKIVFVVVLVIGIAFVSLVSFLAINFIRADKVKIWGVEYEISEELSQTRKDLETQVELVAFLF